MRVNRGIECSENEVGRLPRQERRGPDFFCLMRPTLRRTTLKLARAELLALIEQKGVSNAALAEQIGYDPISLAAHISAGVPNWRLRWRLERVLSYPPLWSPDSELQGRRQCERAYGCDPRLLTLGELKSLCRRVGAQSPGVRQRELWFQSLMCWFAAHPQAGSQIEENHH
jgi:hypothetical protein